MRVVAYLDQAYWSAPDGIHAQRSFVAFLGALARRTGGFTLLGRLSPGPARAHYRLDPAIAFRPLPGYTTAASATAVLRALPGSLRVFREASAEADVVWLLGPSPFAILFALAARCAGRPVVLGVRQDLPAYARARHPGRRTAHAAAWAMELVYRVLARRRPVVVVGSDLARRYRRAARVEPVSVALVSEQDVLPLEAAREEPLEPGVLRLLTVSRLDPEKNPLLLADVLARLVADDPRWRLEVCGDGPLAEELAQRFEALGVAEHAALLGHVSMADGLLERYRAADAFLHVSWTEGLPQVLSEAFASLVPVVATDVGGVGEAAGGAALLVPPGAADAAAEAVLRLRREPETRRRLVAAGRARVAQRTIEAETARVAALLEGAALR